MSWEKVKLGDVCLKIGSGATPKGGSAVYVDKGTTFIRSQNVYNLSFDYSGLVFVNEEAAQKLKGVTIEKNDILLNITGDSVARTCIVPTELIPARVNQHVAIIRPNNERLNPEFLNYYLASPFMQQFMLGLAVGKGASRNAMTKDMIANFEVPCPPMTVQENIVNILSSYDNLMKNNQKQIKLLEEEAQRLYKEWFVDLHFPGYENTPITDGVPDGWNRKKVVDCLSFHGNGGWGKENPIGKNEHPGKVIRGTDIEDVKSGRFTEVPLRYHTDNDIAKRTLKPYDLVFELSNGNINNIGRCLLIDELILKNCGKNTICASFCKLLRPIDSLHSLILYWEIQDMQTSGRMLPLKKHGANGINNFDFDGFLNHELLVSDNTNLIKPINEIMKEIGTIQGKITLLTEMRDRLLPKLMSG